MRFLGPFFLVEFQKYLYIQGASPLSVLDVTNHFPGSFVCLHPLSEVSFWEDRPSPIWARSMTSYLEACALQRSIKTPSAPGDYGSGRHCLLTAIRFPVHLSGVCVG